MKRKKNKCIICGKMFSPDKWHPHQKVCFNEICRKAYRKKSLIEWRKRYPDYFKDRTDNLEQMQIWRSKHPSYYREYRKHNPELREKHREYMRNYRAKKKSNDTNGV